MNSTFRVAELSILATVSILAGCTKEIDNGGFKSGSALSLGTVTTESMLTKSVITGTTFPADEAAKGIGLFLTAADGGNYDGQASGYSNIKYSNDGNGWASDSPIMLSATEGVLYGYFPYSASVTDLAAVPVESSLNGTDYMYAAPVTKVSKFSAGVSLTMKHALARVSVKFVKDASYTGAGSLTAFSMESKGFSSSGKMNAKTGGVTPDGANSVSYAVTENLTGNGIIEECLLVPTTDTDRSLTLKCTIDGMEYSLDFSEADTLCIRQGVNSTAKVTLIDKGLSISGTGIGDLSTDNNPTIILDGNKEVTVTRSNETGIDDDVFMDVTSDGSTVTIKALAALTGRFAKCTCTPSGKATCTPSIDETTGICTFTITDVQEDITAEVGYIGMCKVRVNFDSSRGSVSLNGSPVTSGTETSVYACVNGLTSEGKSGFKFFRWSDVDKNRELSRSDRFNLGVKSDTTITAEFCYADAIPALFSVSATKRVFFSKGNLWCDGTGSGYTDAVPVIKSWGFESNQYDSKPTSYADRSIDHISHFMWCKSASESVKQKYEETGTASSDIFFTDKADFAVNGVSAWRTLTGGEWQYLLNERTMTFGKPGYTNKVSGVTIGESTYKGMFIYPDDYNGNAVGASGGPDTWADINAAGIVFLPTAGARNGYFGNADVINVGNSGSYWSGSPINDSDDAYYLYFFNDYVNPGNNGSRPSAFSTRLVAEYQSEPDAE